MAALGVAGIALLWLKRSEAGPRERLIAAMPAEDRWIEPRLTRFPWRRHRTMRATASLHTTGTAFLRFASAAAEILQQKESRQDGETASVAAEAEIMLGRYEEAAAKLERLVERDPKDAAAWNDLAAVRHLIADTRRDATEWPRALAAADSALELNGSFQEAHFNRALILTRMGATLDAADAWQSYLAMDGASPWAAEARERNAALPPVRRAARDALRELDAADPAAAATIEGLVREFPQEVRAWSETELLGRWGEAVLKNDGAGAARTLDVVRRVASALRPNGELLLADCVAQIDATVAGGAKRHALAETHVAYRGARLVYRDLDLPNAEKQLAAAASRFEALSSPMAGVARFYAASVMFDRNEIGAATAALESLAASDLTGHPALEAQARSKLGLAYGYEGRWSESLRELLEALRGFRAVGETGNAAFTEALIADTYELAGEHDEAWPHRLAALETLNRHGAHNRVVATLADAVRAAERSGDRRLTRSLSALETAAATRTQSPLLIADALKREALSAHADGAGGRAWTALGSARKLAAGVRDSGLRRRLDAECDFAEGVLVRERNAERSLGLLSSSVTFLESAGVSFAMPDALLERARTYRRLGRKEEARRDLAQAVERVERQRSSSLATDGVIFAHTEVFAEMVDHLLDDGQVEPAFAYAERARNRALHQRIAGGDTPSSVADLQAALPPATAMLSFFPLGDETAVFSLTHRDLRVVRLPSSELQLREVVGTLLAGLARRDPVADIRATASRSFEMILPAASIDGEVTSLVIIASGALERLPWPVLFDRVRSQYLVERYEVVVAPSASVWRHETRRLSESAGQRVLVATSNGAGRPDLPRLDAVVRESERIVRMYPDAHLLDNATPSRFLEEAQRADVIHFSGHAESTVAKLDPALVFAPEADGNDALYASRIAAAVLPRTRVVVLAACDTMRSETQRPDRLPSVARGFLTAGVPAVIGTLWPVEDGDAAMLFPRVHQRLAAGDSPSRALRTAQLDLLRSLTPSAAHPSVWGSALSMGGSQPQSSERTQR